MKKEDNISKKKGIKKGPSIKTAISRAKRIGNGVKKTAVSAAIITALLGSPVDFTNITRVQAAETDAGATDVKKLPRVSLKELKGLDKKHGACMVYKDAQGNYKFSKKNWRGRTAHDYEKTPGVGYDMHDVLSIPLPNSNRRILFAATIGFDEQGKKVKRVGVMWINKKGEKRESAVSLDKLAKLYKQETGKDLKYVRLVGENGVDEDGPYTIVHVIPIDHFGQDLDTVERDTPVLAVGYWLNDGVSHEMRIIK